MQELEQILATNLVCSITVKTEPEKLITPGIKLMSAPAKTSYDFKDEFVTPSETQTVGTNSKVSPFDLNKTSCSKTSC